MANMSLPGINPPKSVHEGALYEPTLDRKADPSDDHHMTHQDHEVTCWFCGHEYIWSYEIGRCPVCNHHQPDIF
jgi:Zn finger protein HypA/HybF involved in hydrogenase expression